MLTGRFTVSQNLVNLYYYLVFALHCQPIRGAIFEKYRVTYL